MHTYEHRQTAQWIVLIATLAAVAYAMAAFMTGLYVFFGIALLLLAVALGFGTLSTRVTDAGISWAYTLGWPGQAISLADVAKAEVTTTTFWEGWGIHWTIWHGWLWNAAGYGAVMIHRRSGGVVTVGTDDPQGLYEAIVERLPKP